MPEQYIITGTIAPADGVERAGITVQAFDRDLPSLERRRGTPPQMLGGGITDAEGRFQIIYTLEQFHGGEGIASFRRMRQENADLSFRVFDRAGQELNIKYIEVLDLKYRPDQIIFNVASPQELSIFVEVPQKPGISEYEQLIGLIAPVVEDLPLIELSDEDVVFLSNELSLEQQPEVRQRLEWLRRCALLAQDTNLPVEAFYGWGRKDVPAGFAELAAVPLKDLPAVLEKLTGLPADKLREALLASIEENIIPARIRERADAIADAIRRRAQKDVAVRLRLEREPTGEPLAGYMVTTFDADANNRDLGTDVTDVLGEFVVAYSVDVAGLDAEHNLRFRVRGPAIAEAVEVTDHIRPDASAVVSVRVSLPSVDPTLQQLRDAGHIDMPSEFIDMLEQKHAIRSLADIRRRGGLSRIPKLRALDVAATRRLDALADLDRLSSDLNETSALLDHHYDSVFAIATASRREFIALMTANRAGFSERRAIELHVAAKAQTDILDQIFAGIAIDFAAGIRPSSGFASGDYFPPFPKEQKHE